MVSKRNNLVKRIVLSTGRMSVITTPIVFVGFDLPRRI